MSHPGNDEILENVYEEVKEEFIENHNCGLAYD